GAVRVAVGRCGAIGLAVGSSRDIQVGRVDGQAGIGLMDRVVAEFAVGIGERGADRVVTDAGTGPVAAAGEGGGDAIVVEHAAERAAVADRRAIGLAVGVGGDVQVGGRYL